VVNVSGMARPIDVTLQGATKVSASAAGEVLTGDPSDQNSIGEPTKVAPKAVLIMDAGPKFTHEFPAHSVTVLQLNAK
jgi:alpha-L-arabinofuranosidase